MYTNSPLVSVRVPSPNHSGQRKHKIDTITIHCVVGQLSAEDIGELFLDPSNEVSSNYGIGFDGEIGLYVDEQNRSWCSSSAANDNRAVTIEVASDMTEPYAVTDKAYAALIELVADICKRNDIKELKWEADKSLIGQVDKQNMTVHRWFSKKKTCPGTFLFERHGDIAAKVNAKLSDKSEPVSLEVGDIVTFNGNTHYGSTNSTRPVSCKPGKAKITSIYPGGMHPFHLINVKGGGSTVYGWVDEESLV